MRGLRQRIGFRNAIFSAIVPGPGMPSSPKAAAGNRGSVPQFNPGYSTTDSPTRVASTPWTDGLDDARAVAA